MSPSPLSHRRERLAATELYLILTLPAGGALPLPVVDTLLATGGIGMLQLRAPDADEASLRRHVADLRPRCAAAGTLLLLNDAVALAAELDLDGAHVGQSDLEPSAARALLGPARLLGLSTHDEKEIEAARRAPVDYLGLGPCFATDSKALTRAPGGPALVARCLPLAGRRPVFPIGGIGPATIGRLAAAGADRVALGAGLLAAPDPAAAVSACRAALARA